MLLSAGCDIMRETPIKNMEYIKNRYVCPQHKNILEILLKVPSLKTGINKITVKPGENSLGLLSSKIQEIWLWVGYSRHFQGVKL